MAVTVADMNQIRVDVLGRSVDQPGAAWTTMPPGNANTLQTTARIINRAINDLNTNVGNALNGTVGFDSRFNGVVGNEEAGDQAAFDSIGSNLIQAVAALVAGGGVAPGTLSFTFEFPDPLTTSDFVEFTVTQDCTIPADLDGTQFVGIPQTDDMHFELTEQTTGDVLGEVYIGIGNVMTLSGVGGEITAGTVLRMTATDIVGGPISPSAVITLAAERKTVPPVTGKPFEFAQVTPETEWTIQHQLNQRIVAVQVIDSGGTAVLCDIDYETANRCVLTFARPKTGTAVVRR